MGLGDALQAGWAGQTKGYQPGSTRGLISSIIDPLDIFSGRTATRDLEAAQAAQAAAQQAAIRSQEEMYGRGLEAMAPYREYGMRALPGLQASLQPGSQLGTMRSTIGQQVAPQALAQRGFNPAMIDELMGQYQAAIGAEEATAQTARARDLMNLGMGGAGQAAGMAGQQGRSLADIYLQGAQMQGQQAINQALARRQQGMGVMYGGMRGLQNYLGGAYG
jgi:hypothetical protein